MNQENNTHAVSVTISLGDYGDKVFYSGSGTSAEQAAKNLHEMELELTAKKAKRMALKARDDTKNTYKEVINQDLNFKKQ